MPAYYNEIDDYAADWLENLIRDKLIAPGVVDRRSIEDVCPDDLRGFEQCHFFAGVGLWSLALRIAGWADDRPIWTGSCPCQPFSAAGKGDGFDDERHLWPAFFHLVTQRRPAVVCGEQVASKDGYAWLDLVQTDLEGLGYAAWPVVFPSAGVGAPHERHRQYWVAMADPDYERRAETGRPDAGYGSTFFARGGPINDLADAESRGFGIVGGEAWPGGRGHANVGFPPSRLDDPAGARHGGPLENAERLAREQARLRLPSAASGFGGMADAENSNGRRELESGSAGSGRAGFAGGSAPSGLDNADEPRSQGYTGDGSAAGRETEGRPVAEAGVLGGVADPRNGEREQLKSGQPARVQPQAYGEAGGEYGLSYFSAGDGRPGPTNGFWRDCDWVLCNDPAGPRWRAVEPESFPLAYGLPRSLGTLGPGLGGLYAAAGVGKDSLDAAKRYRVGVLRGMGNAINPWQAAEFIAAWEAAAP